MKKQLFYLLAPLLIACSGSETEEKAAQAVGENYDTLALFSKEFISEDGEGKPIYYLEVTPTKDLDTSNIAMVASNMGLIIYENLSAEERKEYDRYQIVTTVKDQAFSQAYGFNEKIELGLAKAKIFDDFSQHIINEAYAEADNLVIPKNRGEDHGEVLKKYLQHAISQHGKISYFRRTGYGQNEAETMILINGYFAFDSGYTLHYYIGASKEKEESLMIGYEFL